MKTIRNIIKVITGNLTTIISGIFISFLLPKIISLSDYGYYKIFTLYFNYLGVLSLGIIDGIVLKYGDKEYNELDREKFRSYFILYSILQIIASLIIMIISFFIENIDYQFVILLLAANLFPANITGYFQQISQITQRFDEFTMRRIIQSICNIVIVLGMFFIYKINMTMVTYKMYLLGLFIINLVLMIWYIITYKDIILGKRYTLLKSISDVKYLIKIGFPLMLSNLCSTLLLSIDRQIVSIFFSSEEYATYAFAYSMLSLITIATTAVSTVIYPVFKRAGKTLLAEQYPNLQAVLLSAVYLIILVYFPLNYFIKIFLPNYEYSIVIFRIILPGLALSSSISVIMHNYYKVFDYSTSFFVKSIFTLIMSSLLNFTAFFLFKTREAISISSVLSLLVWYIYTEHGLKNRIHCDKKSLIYLLVMGLFFYWFSSFNICWLGGVCYFVFYILVTFISYNKQYNSIIKIIKK